MNEMRQAIAAATVITAAPSNLRPTLDTAATDLPPSSFNGCHADFDAVEQGPCVFGDDNGTHTVVLFGDSHIEQWLPAIAAAGTHEHWRVVDWTKAACPVAMRTVDNPQLKRTYTECDRWRTQTIDRIRNLHPDLVIAGQSDQVPGNLVSDAAWAQDTVTTLDKLKGSGAKIDIMLDIPVSDRDVPTCISAHLDDVRRCAIPSSRSYVFPRRHTMVAQRVTEAGFDAIEPFGWLCTPSACPVVVGNLLVYRNADHLTAEYSRWLAPMVQPLLKFRA
jgi:hypothetical protein